MKTFEQFTYESKYENLVKEIENVLNSPLFSKITNILNSLNPFYKKIIRNFLNSNSIINVNKILKYANKIKFNKKEDINTNVENNISKNESTPIGFAIFVTIVCIVGIYFGIRWYNEMPKPSIFLIILAIFGIGLAWSTIGDTNENVEKFEKEIIIEKDTLKFEITKKGGTYEATLKNVEKGTDW